MRLSDHRYSRDQRALQVATRMIDMEVRTGTIREFTGLSDGRIRDLSHACGVSGYAGPRARHRGRSPSNVSCMLKRPHTRVEAATLLSVCRLMGITSAPRVNEAGRITNGVAHAEQLCDAFWTFRYLLPDTEIGFEHMLLLLAEAGSGGEIAAVRCASCRALVVLDRMDRSPGHRCSRCSQIAPMKRGAAYATQYHRVAETPGTYRTTPSARSGVEFEDRAQLCVQD